MVHLQNGRHIIKEEILNGTLEKEIFLKLTVVLLDFKEFLLNLKKFSIVLTT